MNKGADPRQDMINEAKALLTRGDVRGTLISIAHSLTMFDFEGNHLMGFKALTEECHAIALRKGIIGQSPDPSGMLISRELAMNCCQLAELLMQKKLWQESIDLWELALSPNDLMKAILPSMLEFNLDDYYGNIYYNLGYCCEEVDKLDMAITYLKKALEYNPSDIGALFNLGMYSGRQGHYADAVEFFEKYLILYPKGAKADEVKEALIQARQELEKEKCQPPLPEIVKKALELQHQGIKEAQAKQLISAIEKWQAAIELKPPPGLEMMLRTNLVQACFEEISTLPQGSHLTKEQAHFFLIGEKHSRRLLDLCFGDGPEGPVVDIAEEAMSKCRFFAEDSRDIIMRSWMGWYIFPGLETPRRMIEYGKALADNNYKKEAINPLTDALPFLNIDDPLQKDIAAYVHFRLAPLLSDLGDQKRGAFHAKQALIFGIQDPQNIAVTLMKEIIKSAGESVPDNSNPQRG